MSFKAVARLICFLFVVLITAAKPLEIQAAPAIRPCDPNANAAAVKVFAFLARLNRSTDQGVISGQYIGSAACCSAEEEPHFGAREYIEKLKDASGQTVGIVGVDYNDTNHGVPGRPETQGMPIDYSELNSIVKHYAREGSLTLVSWHVSNPWSGKQWNDIGALGKLTDLIDDSKPVSHEWRKRLDAAARGLSELQDDGVVVLWRPFLEVNGPWDWWGAAKPEPDEFRRVWVDMFDYFTKKNCTIYFGFIRQIIQRQKTRISEPRCITILALNSLI